MYIWWRGAMGWAVSV